MSESSEKLEQARAVKKKVKAIFTKYGIVIGVGITRWKNEYAVKVNLETDPEDPQTLPTEIDGVHVVVDVIGKSRKQQSPDKNKS